MESWFVWTLLPPTYGIFNIRRRANLGTVAKRYRSEIPDKEKDPDAMGGLALLFYLAPNSTIINLVKVAVPRGGAYMSGILTMGEISFLLDQ